ncbi:MAG: hypothetical protein NVV73_21730 [Cellvibrionaceae bacterium]|nr:hypothetical protein [Cellvibrionaceae bacterium]
MSNPYPWLFSRIGGFDQVLLRSGEDLKHLEELDPKLWAALACPVKGLFFDEKTLQLIDVDSDGRIRLPEIVKAVNWAAKCLKNPDLLLKPAAEIPLAELNENDADGAAILASAKTMLHFLGKPDSEVVTLADAESQQAAMAVAPLNGDGIILADSADDPELKALIGEVQAAYPGIIDVSGKPGVDLPAVEKFYAAVTARAAWLEQGKADWLSSVNCETAYAALSAVRAKIDDFFARCRASRFDARAIQQLNQPEAAWTALSSDSLSADCHEFADFPLAMVSADAVLPLDQGVNPAWEAALVKFKKDVVVPLEGEKDSLTFAEWQALKERFDAYQQWLSAEAGKEVAALSRERIQQILQEPHHAAMEDLVRQDMAKQPQVAAFAAVEKLLRFRLHLKALLNNFVNFTEFYGAETRAVFEAGTLYLDGRACELCIEVHDPAKHAALAGLSKCFLAYCDCTRPDGAKKTIVAAFTGGDADYLLVGRNGVFYDRAGNDWDATITKLIENPISIPQAFFSPYKRLIRFIEERAAKSATNAEASSESLLQSTTEKTLATTDPKAAQAGPKPKIDVGVVAALGVAVGGIATAVGLLLQAFFGLGWLMPLGLIGLLLLISGPSVFIAWLKLRQRNLGPILDASGWAVNGQVKINVPFGGKLTEVAKLPPGSRRNLADPYAEKKKPWGAILVALLVLIALAVGGWCLWTGKCPAFPRFNSSTEVAVEAPAES